MHGKRYTRAGGMTLIEALIGMMVISIAAVGTMRYQFYSTRQMQQSRAEITATRIAQLLLADWKAHGATFNYDPELLNMQITHISGSDGFNAAGDFYKTYRTVSNNLPLRIELTRPVGYPRPIRIKAKVSWRTDYTEGEFKEGDPSVELTTYARGDEAAN